MHNLPLAANHARPHHFCLNLQFAIRQQDAIIVNRQSSLPLGWLVAVSVRQVTPIRAKMRHVALLLMLFIPRLLEWELLFIARALVAAAPLDAPKRA
jgi:hypothetical protein